MDFTLTDEQRMMAETLRNLLDAECTVPQLRKLLAEDKTRDEKRWRKLFELGLGGVLVSEENGGLGLGELDFALVAEECGRAALPEPLIEQAGIAASLLQDLSGRKRGQSEFPGSAIDAGEQSRQEIHSDPFFSGAGGKLLAGIVAGDIPVVIGHPANPFVLEADAAEILLLPRGGELHLVKRRHVDLTLQPSIDPFRRLYRVDWLPSNSTLLADAEQAAPLWDAALDRGALFAAAQCLGIAQRVVEIAVAYAKDRQQFGKPIGSYQAIKHHLATVQVKIEFVRPVVHAAAALFAPGDTLSAARISHAKLAAGEAAELACRTAIQVHGAMGYSWEVDVHFFLKRALALAGTWGDRAFHRRRVAHRLFETALPIGADQIFANEDDRHVA